MTRSRTGDDMYISPEYNVSHWRNLKLDLDTPDENQWKTAADILKDRIEGRFLKPTQALIDLGESSTTTFGFAILALDFLVIETVQGFRKGYPDHQGKSKELVKDFLVNWRAFQDCVPDEAEREDRALKIFTAGRCALHHTGSTDNLIVRVLLDQMIQFHSDGGIEINRNTFHKELCAEFDRYIEELKNPASRELRANFQKKMDFICNGSDTLA